MSPNAGFATSPAQGIRKSCGRRRWPSQSPSCVTLDYKHTWRTRSKAHVVSRGRNLRVVGVARLPVGAVEGRGRKSVV